MNEPSDSISRRGFVRTTAVAALAGAGTSISHANVPNPPQQTTPGFPYLLDDNGIKGVAISSWLDKARVGLILNDFQNFCIDPAYGFTNEYTRKRYPEIVLPNTLKLIKRFHEMNQPIIYTLLATRHKQCLDLPGLCRRVLARRLKKLDGTPYHLHIDEHSVQPPDELKPDTEDIVIVKTSSGAFNSSDIDNVLRSNGLTCLVFTGGISELCLHSTVRGAYDRGYLCTVAEDATITGDAEKQYWAMKFLDSDYAWVTKTDEILKRLA
jgi:nicotinamidase-related amidase